MGRTRVKETYKRIETGCSPQCITQTKLRMLRYYFKLISRDICRWREDLPGLLDSLPDQERLEDWVKKTFHFLKASLKKRWNPEVDLFVSSWNAPPPRFVRELSQPEI